MAGEAWREEAGGCGGRGCSGWLRYGDERIEGPWGEGWYCCCCCCILNETGWLV